MTRDRDDVDGDDDDEWLAADSGDDVAAEQSAVPGAVVPAATRNGTARRRVRSRPNKSGGGSGSGSGSGSSDESVNSGGPSGRRHRGTGGDGSVVGLVPSASISRSRSQSQSALSHSRSHSQSVLSRTKSTSASTQFHVYVAETADLSGLGVLGYIRRETWLGIGNRVLSVWLAPLLFVVVWLSVGIAPVDDGYAESMTYMFVYTGLWAGLCTFIPAVWFRYLLENFLDLDRLPDRYVSLQYVFAPVTVGLQLIVAAGVYPVPFMPLTIGAPAFMIVSALYYLSFAPNVRRSWRFIRAFVLALLVVSQPPVLFGLCTVYFVYFRAAGRGVQIVLSLFYNGCLMLVERASDTFAAYTLKEYRQSSAVFAFQVMIVGDIFGLLMYPTIVSVWAYMSFIVIDVVVIFGFLLLYTDVYYENYARLMRAMRLMPPSPASNNGGRSDDGDDVAIEVAADVETPSRDDDDWRNSGGSSSYSSDSGSMKKKKRKKKKEKKRKRKRKKLAAAANATVDGDAPANLIIDLGVDGTMQGVVMHDKEIGKPPPPAAAAAAVHTLTGSDAEASAEGDAGLRAADGKRNLHFHITTVFFFVVLSKLMTALDFVVLYSVAKFGANADVYGYGDEETSSYTLSVMFALLTFACVCAAALIVGNRILAWTGMHPLVVGLEMTKGFLFFVAFNRCVALLYPFLLLTPHHGIVD